MIERPTSDPLRLGIRFGFHEPRDCLDEKYESLRFAMFELALDIERLTPSGREQAIALTKLEEAFFWAVAAVVRVD